ncbi:unnamed protein product [Brassicogethes aeneus]|uniref:Uncharacterized protein n=1 Tax=Brassicogethes aeneus TaxID=1431903 RepID=A0A9P0AXD9_BRAAE|nr:unnamed protein product [Brassicogethes aeneus]
MLKQEQKDIASVTKQHPFQVSSSSSSNDEADLSTFSLPTSSTTKEPLLLNDNLAISLDVAKLSNRKATAVLTTTLQSLGCDPSIYNINPSSVRRQRMKIRQKNAESLKSEFRAEVPLTIHWDGKMIEDISGHEIVDRLPIIVPKLSCGTGDSAASAVYETLLTWGLDDQIKCMSFDTTATNTGPRNGACILLEQKIKKDMLWLACRHHIMEIMLEAVLLQALGPSTENVYSSVYNAAIAINRSKN